MLRLDGDRQHQVTGIPDRLPDREIAGSGQHLCLLADLRLLCAALKLPKTGADDRHHRRDRIAHHHDPGRRLVACRVPHLLSYGLAVILVFIGTKMSLIDIYKIPVAVALGVVMSRLALTMRLSVRSLANQPK